MCGILGWEWAAACEIRVVLDTALATPQAKVNVEVLQTAKDRLYTYSLSVSRGPTTTDKVRTTEQGCSWAGRSA